MELQEKKLLEEYAQIKKQYEQTQAQADRLKKLKDIKEQLLVSLLVSKGAETTAKYDGLGFARLRPMDVRTVSVDKANEPSFFEFVKETGHGDIIKLGIHPTTLRSFIKTILAEDVELPKYVYYESKQNVTFYDRSKK